MLLHLLSGVLIGITYLIIRNFYTTSQNSGSGAMFVALFLAFFIGILWEAHELYFGVTSFSDGILYTRDTLTDLFLDVFGSFLGVLYGLKILKQYE